VRLGEQKLARARQGGPVADLWLETASVLADGAAELDRDHAPAWALKADITPDTIDKLAWYRRARDLNDNSGWDYAYGHAQGTFSAAFFTAIKEQKTAYIERSSRAGVHWLAEGPNGESPILVALDADDSATVATTFRVFDHDPVVEGGPLLHLAASRDLSGAVSGLLESEVPTAWEDEDGKTAYYIAISTGSEAAAQVLAAEEPPDHLALMRLALTLAEVQTADKLGQIGMDQAIKADDLAAAGRLLRTNARLITLPRDLQDGYASWAVRNGASEWLQLFLRNGAFVDDTDLEGNPLLYLSLESEQFEVAEYLIEHGAAVDSQTTQTGESAMHAAVRLGTPWVDRLLGEQAIPDLADKAGRTPLHNAVELDSIEIIQRLIAAQADTSLQDGEGATPAMLAAKRRDSEMLDLLLPVTVAIDVQDDRGLTLVHHVVAQKLMPTLSALIERDARLDLADAAGDTPMHVALTECSDGAARA
ncbi:MAG: ankyrin repeat domain-containing protein, partial [Myxococcota bacterium]|nr:ankyrin repeat domain-containing protein [Myxococcota bacterium]